MTGAAPIAIVGRGCVLPGALDPAALWRLVREGEVAIGAVPEGRWRVPHERVLTFDPKDAADRAWSDRGGYVQGFDARFDPAGFAVDAGAIAGLDPLLRWTLHASREALREAGIEGPRESAGVILGNLSFPTAAHAELVERHWRGGPPIDPRERFHSSLPAALTARALSLRGASSFCLDAACASSLYAIALACDALRDRRADLMLAGAVNCTDDLFIHIGFCALDALSKTGQSRPFHADADGLVPAEGAAIVALMRLEDALREARPVLGVIRGVGLANDGRAKSFLAPAEDGQVRAMRAAHRESGLSPSDIGWVECHATGTPVGDATEVRSTARVFEGVADVPVGSLKANLGHLITTAGAAGLLKVLAAMEAGVLPPTPSVGARMNGALAGTPLRVVDALEPWDQAVRRAGISAFGFGGNDAHLVVEQYVPSTVSTPFAPPKAEPIAIVGIGARIGPFDSARAFADALSTGVGGRRTDEVVLPLETLRTPPADLEPALGQQTMLLAAALDARVEGLDPERTAVLIGMQCDTEVARYGLRWRTGDGEARDTFAPRLTAAGVLGTMPNIPANRINRELDLRGPSYTLSADELSGIRALEIAARGLRTGELDAALVGAVDLACAPVHEAAAKALSPEGRGRGGDAAVVLVLERLSDARAKGRAVLAIVDELMASPGELVLGLDGALTARFGHAHAASGLVHVAAAALALHRRARPGERVGAWESQGERRARVEVDALFGERAVVTLREDAQTAEGEVALTGPPVMHPLVLAAHPAPPRVTVGGEAEPMEAAPALALGPQEPVDVVWEDGPLAMAPAPGTVRIERSPSPPRRSEPRAARPAAAPPAARAGAPKSVLVEAIEARQREIADQHAEYLRTQTELHQRFLASRANALAQLAGRAPAMGLPAPAPGAPPSLAAPEPLAASTALPRSAPAARSTAPTPSSPPIAPELLGAPPAASPAASIAPAPLSPPVAPESLAAPAPLQQARRSRGLTPGTPPPPTGRTFSRAELQVHASGTISELFGPLFAPQDRHAVQVRMPEPPLLLADRVTGLVGEPGTMKTGTVWTETDVTEESWYLHQGRMPAGMMIESGQADLFLISWLGADLLNQGERRYRLLGCQLTWHRSPPTIGETLAYDIHVDSHARQGDVRLFFFHYDCHIDGAPALTVRNGQAGFFTDEELAESAGVLWDPEDHEVAPGGRVDPPAVRTVARSFGEEALEALARGDLVACFGPGYEPASAHVRTPTIAGGHMRFFERVTDFDSSGGPRRRGYLRATKRISPDDWYFRGHFKNDPCMPGTLMFEGCLSAMAFYLIGLGYSLDRDGWRFEPIPDETYSMRCRGQVLPTSKELVYEVFVDEVHDGPFPRLYADILCTVDGLKAFHAPRVGFQLVPDWPMTDAPEVRSAEVAVLDGVALDERALLASAWGKPSLAFGPRYAEFDGLRRAPRLPGPPYHMVSRVTKLEGEPWSKRPGASVEIEYDVPPDAWYFADGGSGAMPYALLLEAALQPCGWLATAVGSTLGGGEDLRFRNLDGEGEVLAEVHPDAGTLRTRATLTSITDTPSMIIVGFDVETAMRDVTVARLKTVFGFFPDAAFRDQAGLPVGDAERALFEAEGEPSLVRDRPELFDGDARLPRGRLGLLDAITFFDPEGGRAGLGAARAESGIDPGAWFFRAHFFQDPVQPGSLGIEAMLALLRYTMRALGLHEGMRAPRFTPVARAQRWKYRGQVLPSNARTAITLEVTTIERGPERVLAEAEASFWVDGKRIYEAHIGAELVESEDASVIDALSPTAPEPAPAGARTEHASIAQFWRDQLGVGPNPAEDLYLALHRRFVGRVDGAAHLGSLASRPALYLANHQTAIETLMLSITLGAVSGVPLITLAKAEHRESWLGQLLGWIFAHPSVVEPELTAYFDRDDPASLPALLRSLPADRSLLIHVEGTRARSCRQSIERISGVPLELAIERDLPIVPVRITGGLPVAPLERKLDFPLAMAAQDLWIGAPIASTELAGLDYKARVARVRDAIESLGPQRDAPNEGDLAFAAEVARHMERAGIDLPHAVLACAWRAADRPSPLTRRVLDGALDESDAEHRWARELASRLALGRADDGRR